MFPPELIVTFIAAMPILELRAAMPVGKLLGMPIESIFFWSIVGSILPVFFILKFLDPVSKFLMKHSKWFNRLLTNIFEKTRKKHTKKFEEIGAVLLLSFTAIPFPGFGAWTGALIAYLFNVPYWKAIGLITAGVIIMAVIVGMTVESVTQTPALIRLFIK